MKKFLIIFFLGLSLNVVGQNYSYLGVSLTSAYLESNFPNYKVTKGEYDEERDLIVNAEITGSKDNYTFKLQTGSNGKIWFFLYDMNNSVMSSVQSIDRIIDDALRANNGTITTNERQSSRRFIEKEISTYGKMRITAQWSTNTFGDIFPSSFMIMYSNVSISLGR